MERVEFEGAEGRAGLHLEHFSRRGLRLYGLYDLFLILFGSTNLRWPGRAGPSRTTRATLAALAALADKMVLLPPSAAAARPLPP